MKSEVPCPSEVKIPWTIRDLINRCLTKSPLDRPGIQEVSKYLTNIKIFANGDEYEGEWKDDQRNGQGTMYYADGDRYEGEWKDGKMHGQGIFYNAKGNRYEGEWKYGVIDGQGTAYSVKGGKYEGEFKDNKRNGQGTIYYANGNKYEGEHKDNKLNGQGTYYYAKSGNRYEGEWKDGKRNGQGTMYYADGSTKSGEWNNDEYVGGSVSPKVEKPSDVVKTSEDGRYNILSSGVIQDTKTGLEWYVGPDEDTTWDEAKAWTESLTVARGGWRMPTREELRGIFQDGKGTRNMDPVFKTTGWWVWTDQLYSENSSEAWLFSFNRGNGFWDDRRDSYARGFAVRSGR